MKSGEFVAGWSLTKACNLRCKHCYHDSGPREKDELSTEQALQVVEKLAGSGVTMVNFGGGECALRCDFVEIVEALNRAGIEVSYTTNGTTLDRFVDRLDLFHDIGVSIDFANAEKHDEFRGGIGTYRTALDCIDTLVREGVNTEIVTCITRLNAFTEELQALHNLCRDKGVEYWRLNRYRPMGRGLANNDFLALDKTALKRAYDFLDSVREPGSAASEPLFRAIYGGSYLVPGDPSGRTAFRIQTNGEVSPSVFLSESGGNILHDGLDDILGSPVFRALRQREPRGKCTGCGEYRHCQGGDAGMSYLQYGHFHGPDPLCFKDLGSEAAVAKDTNPDPNVHELYLCTLYIPIGGANESV